MGYELRIQSFGPGSKFLLRKFRDIPNSTPKFTTWFSVILWLVHSKFVFNQIFVWVLCVVLKFNHKITSML